MEGKIAEKTKQKNEKKQKRNIMCVRCDVHTSLYCM